ncbi:MAG: major capsid protein, partial [Chitinophagaceae bacterium]|nr:major capsid protein [Chitinophagaceae bacterium]
GKWEGINATNTLVMADVVSMDSTLPLKKRDAVSRASGDIPKMGMKMYLNEKQLTDLDTIVAQGATLTGPNANERQIVITLFNDTPKCTGGVYERLERMFLEGLSTGVTLVEDDENTGVGIRLDYGYLNANKFGVSTLWSNTASLPFDDIQRVLDKAREDGNVITTVKIDRVTMNNIAKTTQAKEYYAFQVGFVGNNIQVPTLEQLNTMTSARFGFTFEIIERSVRYEKNGVQTSFKPWQEGMVVFLPSDNVGQLVWARLAEQNHPVQGVSYQTADDFILLSKFRKNDPVAEFTTSQARAVPVIAGVDSIYTLDSKTIQA